MFIKFCFKLGYIYKMGVYEVYLRIIFILDGRLIDFINIIGLDFYGEEFLYNYIECVWDF